MPDTPIATVAPCSACGSTEPPVNGRCTSLRLVAGKTKRCGCFRSGNAAAVKTHGPLSAEDRAEQGEVMDRLFDRYGGRKHIDIVTELQIKAIGDAVVLYRREVGSKRRDAPAKVAKAAAQVVKLTAALPPVPAPVPADGTDISTMTREALIAKARDVLASLEGRPAAVPIPPEPETAAGGLARPTTVAPADPVEPPAAAPSVGAPEPAGKAEPACRYCRGSCVGREHRSYPVLHSRDPEEVKRRADEATREMGMSLRLGIRSPFL